MPVVCELTVDACGRLVLLSCSHQCNMGYARHITRYLVIAISFIVIIISYYLFLRMCNAEASSRILLTFRAVHG